MDIRNYIKKQLKDNGAQEITAEVMRGVLLAMVDTGEREQYLFDATAAFGFRGDFPGALATAVAGVRTGAVFISFLTMDDRREMWAFNGGEFAEVSNWQQFTGGIEGMTEEELEQLIENTLNPNL